MKKTTLLLLVALAFATSQAVASPVTVETARKVAVNFWNTYRMYDAKTVTDLQLRTFVELENMYVFVNGDNGFIIVASDDCVRPVLGYSFNTPFPEELHPELRYWLSCYEKQIAVAKTMERKADVRWSTLLYSEVPPEPVAVQAVPMLCHTQWDQGSPYNNQCPYDSTFGERAVVGCVATAMAQIMKRWEHPYCGTGSHSYVHENWAGGHSYSYGPLSADFEHTTYMWELMPDRVIISTSEPKAHALSTLSYHCGVAVDMMYGISAFGGSGAYSSCGWWASACAEHAFFEFFKYDSRTLQYFERYQFSDSAWLAMIDEDLAAGRPMYYDGSDSTGGHAFVLDGSNLDTTYHFNRGWSGYGDGFYAMNNLAPGSGGAGGNATYTFNSGQGAIFGIQPVPEVFDTVVLYDTVCTNIAHYQLYEHTLPVAACDTLLHHLDTVIELHLALANFNTVTFSSNTGGFGNSIDSSYCAHNGLVMPECRFTKSGYRFIGWSLKKRPNGEPVYAVGERVFLHGNVVLYAQWQDTNHAVGIVDLESEEAALWPNPTTGELTIRLESAQNAQLQVFDALGRAVLRCNAVSGTKIDLSDLPDGIYTVQIRTDEGLCNQRVIKHK